MTDFDPIGYVPDADPEARDEAQNLADAVEARRLQGARPHLVVDGATLVRVAETNSQTIDGEFIGFPPESDAPNAIDEIAQLARFAESPASIAIKAIDSTLFVVVTKSADDVAAVRRRFADVRNANVAAELGLA